MVFGLNVPEVHWMMVEINTVTATATRACVQKLGTFTKPLETGRHTPLGAQKTLDVH